MSSPQAVGLFSKRSVRHIQEAAVTSQRGATLNGKILVNANGEVFAQVKPPLGVAYRQIQNRGTTAVKFLLDNVNDCSEENFSGILAGGSALDDGLGSVMTWGITPHRITIYGVGATTPNVCAIEVTVPIS